MDPVQEPKEEIKLGWTFIVYPNRYYFLMMIN
jgi:hypothetical protein